MEPAFQSMAAARTGMKSLISGFLRGPFLSEENRLLREQMETLLAHEKTHEALFQENERLKDLLRFKGSAPWKLIAAQVIARETSLWSRSLLVDKGKEDGLRVGQAVITPTGLVGRVGEVGPSVSRILLVNDPHFRAAAIVSESRLSGLLVGKSSGGCWLTYLPREAKLKAGDSVVTAGGKSFAPAGIPIGVIQQAGEAPADSELFRSVPVRLVVNLSQLEEVLLIAWPLSDSDFSS